MRVFYFILLFTVAILAGAAQAQIYRVVDESGRVTFTDRPPADKDNASPVDLRVPNTQPATELPAVVNQAPGNPQEEFTGYRRFVISQPRHNETITPGQTEITVQVTSEPPLQPGHLVQVLYDGQAVAPPSATNRVRITDLVRGTYSLQARILDEQRRVLAETDTIDVHVKRPSILNRPGNQ